jgi:hypothetical protein
VEPEGDAVTWDNATTTDGEWHGLSLVIDTDTYAGNIEREMLAACTGVINEPTVILEEIASEYDGPDLRHLVTGDAEAYVTPGWSIAAGGERHRVSPEHPFRMPTLSSVHIPLRDEPAADVLDGIKRRALAFAAAGVVDADGYVDVAPFRITGFRLIRERVTTQSRDLGGAP